MQGGSHIEQNTRHRDEGAKDWDALAWEAFCRRRADRWQPHVWAGQATVTRREARRHTFPAVKVVHPDFGETTVRAESKCDAVNQAAKAWSAAPEAISRTAEVWRIEKEAFCDAPYPEFWKAMIGGGKETRWEKN